MSLFLILHNKDFYTNFFQALLDVLFNTMNNKKEVTFVTIIFSYNAV